MSVTELPRKTTLAALRRRLAREIALHREREAAEAALPRPKVRGVDVLVIVVLIAIGIGAWWSVAS